MNENSSVDRTHSARLGLLCIRAEWFPTLHSHGTVAVRAGRTVPGRTHAVTLRVRCKCASSRGWRAFAGEPLRAAGACASWPCDREHLFLSSFHGSERSATGDSCRNSVGNCSPSSPPILFGDICAAGDISNPTEDLCRHTQRQVLC